MDSKINCNEYDRTQIDSLEKKCKMELHWSDKHHNKKIPFFGFASQAMFYANFIYNEICENTSIIFYADKNKKDWLSHALLEIFSEDVIAFVWSII
jgi:hypothetical protein